jgi:hypothetical protein
LSNSLNIRLPSNLIAAGDETFSIAGVTDAAGRTNVFSCQVGCGSQVALTFLNQPSLMILAIGLEYNTAAAGQPVSYAAPRGVDFNYLLSWLGRAYPVSAVDFSQRIVVLTESDGVTTATSSDVSSQAVDCNVANAQLAAIRAQDIDGGTDPHTHYYGLVQITGGYLRGCSSGIPATPDPSITASGPSGVPTASNAPVNVGSESDQSFAGWYGGHELLHTFGRHHPGFCNNNTADDTSFPNPNGWISKGQPRDFAGLDVGDTSLSLNPTVIWVTGFDIMTYCNQPQWPSGYAYEGARKRILAEHPGFSTNARGDFKRVTGNLVHIVALVNLTRGQGRIAYVSPVSTAAAVVEPSPRVALVFKDASGRTLSQAAAPLHEDSDRLPGQDDRALVDAAVDLPPGAAEVDLALDGAIIASYRPGAAEASPVSNLRLEPAPEGRARRVLRWDSTEAARLPGPAATYVVQGTHDGRTWETFSVGAADLSAAIEDSGYQQVRVITNHGFSRSAPVTIVP